MRVRPEPGIGPSHVARRVEHHVHDGRRAAHQGDAVLVDAAQDLGTVDLAQHHLAAAHPGDRVQHAPPVAVELGERVQVDVAIVDPHVPAERRGVDPDVPVRQLDALRAGRRARRVVDRGGRRLVGFPRSWFHPEAEQDVVGLRSDDPAVLARHARQRIVELRVDEEDASAAVTDDVADLLGDEPEVDRDEDAARPRDAEQRCDQSSGVVADDRDPLADADAELVEAGGDRSRPFGDLGVGERAPRGCRLIRLVDDAGAARVEELGPAQEVVDGQWDEHQQAHPWIPSGADRALRTCLTGSPPYRRGRARQRAGTSTRSAATRAACGTASWRATVHTASPTSPSRRPATRTHRGCTARTTCRSPPRAES